MSEPVRTPSMLRGGKPALLPSPWQQDAPEAPRSAFPWFWEFRIRGSPVVRHWSVETRLLGLLLWLNVASLMSGSQCLAAGVTLITHGLNGNVDDWVISMADRMTSYPPFSGARYTCYELYFALSGPDYILSWTRLGGHAPADTGSGEIFIKLDWRQLANDDHSTYDVAAAVVPRLLQTNFIAELNGHALAELPLHLIGHSRGGSLVCQISGLLGTNGVWVDH